jgi:hypothetical protein
LRRCLEIAGWTAVDEVPRYLLLFRQDYPLSFMWFLLRSWLFVLSLAPTISFNK